MVQKTFGYRILLFIIVAILTIAVAIIPDIISKDVEVWCKQIFGPNYKFYLLGIMMGGSVLIVFLTTDFARGVIRGGKKYQQHKFGVPPTEANRSLLKEARIAISQKADNEKALRLLSTIRLSSLDVEIALLSARLVEESRNRHQGVSSQDETSRASTRIIRDTLYLIDALEKEISIEQEQDETIRAYLQKRYSFRLSQKLAGRQPVNLKYIPSTEGTSEETNIYFVFKGDEEIQQGIAQIFRQSQGRLLIVGDPGAGKTTLLLQLVLELLKSELEAIPVMLNLATWKREFITLETWLSEILPTELGVIKRVPLELLQQNRLILFLDGFDEIKEEDRTACLEALGQYSAQAESRFVISSRKNEYSQIAKDAPVYAQIEVRPLTVEQMIEELEKVGYDQPEAKPLMVALQHDKLLAEVAQTPFYLNLLQVLFSEGKRLSDLKFGSLNLNTRRSELLEYFVNHCLSPKKPVDYSVEQIKHWLSFFASRLKLKNIVNFELTQLQYDWWFWKNYQLFLPFCLFFTVGIKFILIYWSLYVFLFIFTNKSIFLISILVVIILFSLVDIFFIKSNPIIETIEKIRLTRKIIDQTIKKEKWKIISISFILSVVIFFLVKNTILISIMASLGSFFCVFIFGSIYLSLEKSYYTATIVKNPYTRFVSSSKWLHFSFLQHKFLLFQLARQNLLPYKLVAFLSDLSNRHILEFDGATWRFQHRLLQDYFVSNWEPKYNESLELKSLDAKAYNNLGNAYRAQDKLAEAIEQYQIAIRLNPDYANAWLDLGWTHLVSHQYEEAQVAMEKSLILYNQQNHLPFQNLGHIQLLFGDQKEAINYYLTSIRLCKNKEKFFEEMNSDYIDLNLSSYNISRETYDEILNQLRASITTSWR